MGGKSAPPPDYAPLAAASKEAAETMAGLGREQLAFARQQYAEVSPIARQIAQQQIAAQQEQMRQAQDYYNYATTTFRPIEQGLARQAQEFNTEAYREQLAQEAAAAAGRAFGTTQAASERAMRSMGVNPASGAGIGLQTQASLGLAAQRAATMTGARRQAEQMGWARQMDVTGLGRGLPGASLAAYGGATGAGSAGLQSTMAPGTQFGALYGQGVSTIGSGLGMQIQGLGSVLSSQTSYANAMNSQADPFATVLGMGLGAYAGGFGSAAGAKAASDYRIKTDIQRVGFDDRTQLPIYEFAYKALPNQRFRGVMAQEVERLYPEAVSEHPYGFKMVDYAQLGMRMERV